MEKEDKTKQVEDLYEGAMSLYNTIDIETNKKENTYKNAESKIKEILDGEQALYVHLDDEIAGMLFQYLNLGYAVIGVKYLDMITNNKTIAATATGYALETLNNTAKELMRYKEKYGELDKDNIENELKGISKD